jgi:hypothetical protein
VVDDCLFLCDCMLTMFLIKLHAANHLALRDAVRVIPGGRGEAVPAGQASSAWLPGGPGIMPAGTMTGVRGASLEVGA